MRERPSFAPEARLLADQGDKQQRNVTIRQMPPVSVAGIPTVNAPPSGTQDVRVTNPPPPPNVSVSPNFTIYEAQNPKASADAVMVHIGSAVKNALEAYTSDVIL